MRLGIFILLLASIAAAQNAQISGRVTDPSNAVIASATVETRNLDTGVKRDTTTNSDGYYAIPQLPPGRYSVTAQAAGFQTAAQNELKLEVAQNARLDFRMTVGATQDKITVGANAEVLKTESAEVSTVVDQRFIENMPLNGRSVQALIELTPGVVAAASGPNNMGQYSVNGARSDANYYTIDGVSANFGSSVGINPASSYNGSTPAFGSTGGSNNLVSLDALQEFRIQTSSYAPEFGRSPGAQISLVTRSGANQFHGTASDYLRNSVLDANNWFANANRLPKPAERQNDFGGTFSGPIIKDRTFFFFSYEGLRLRQPIVSQSLVPTVDVRNTASAVLQPFLKAFPLPTGPEVIAANGSKTGLAHNDASFSNTTSVDSTSLKIDHNFREGLTIFGRYSYAPGSNFARNPTNVSNATANANTTVTQTATGGLTWVVNPRIVNEFKGNYSRSNSGGTSIADDFGGAIPVPLASVLPPGYSFENTIFSMTLSNTLGFRTRYDVGTNVRNVQQQLNFIDSISITAGSHQIKAGIDYRRLFPSFEPRALFQSYQANTLQTFLAGFVNTATITRGQPADLRYNNVGAYIQDTWKVTPKFTLTYGLRWDVEPAVRLEKGVGVDSISNPATLSFQPRTQLYDTNFKGFAPRVGAAYRFHDAANWGTVVRAGFGLFYDLMNSETANILNYPPLVGQVSLPSTSQGVPFPPNFATIAPPANPVPPYTTFFAVDPKLTLPRVYQWNVAVEQAIGKLQSISVTYIGSKGEKLLTTYQSQRLFENPNVRLMTVLSNGGASNYQGLQTQYKLQLHRGLQLLSAYSWSHAIDNDSDAYTPVLGPSPIESFRANSNFDIRHSFSLGGSYDIPAPYSNRALKAVLGGWALEGIQRARSSPPVNVQQTATTQSPSGSYSVTVYPDLVVGQPLYLSDPHAPYGRKYNPAAFKVIGPFASPTALRQGTAGRNILRAFPLSQLDTTIRRQFNFTERWNVQFRADIFNILNHPNFGAPTADPTSSAFGVATGLLGTTLTPNASTAGFNPLYAVGAPRSVQLSLKLNF